MAREEFGVEDLAKMWPATDGDSWDAAPTPELLVVERDTPGKRLLRTPRVGREGVVARLKHLHHDHVAEDTGADEGVRPRMGKLNSVRRFLKLFDQIERIYRSAASDETKFDLIFGIEEEMQELHPFTWENPDATYGEDMVAFFGAVQALAADLRLATAGLDEDDT